jgi:hypothetical protein
MSEFNEKPDGVAEELISGVVRELAGRADPQIARLRLERRLKQAPRRSRMNTMIKVLAFFTGLILLGGWASQQSFAPWDDGQLITLKAPAEFVPAEYPRWTAVFANHAEELYNMGGHSLVVDYKELEDGGYYFQLGIIGISYSEANGWLRGVMADVPALSGTPYSITQPLLPYQLSVREMIAFDLFGDNLGEERKVVAAWRAAGERPSHIYLIAKSKDYPRRVSMLGR